jgi:hypothetical protein
MHLLAGDEYFVDLRLPGGVDLGPGRSPSLVLTIDVGSWFGAADLDGAPRDQSGAITVDAAHAAALTAALETRVLDSCTLAGGGP